MYTDPKVEDSGSTARERSTNKYKSKYMRLKSESSNVIQNLNDECTRLQVHA
jgi:hypothetical protein